MPEISERVQEVIQANFAALSETELKQLWSLPKVGDTQIFRSGWLQVGDAQNGGYFVRMEGGFEGIVRIGDVLDYQQKTI
jgi:hypothetical protein